MKVVPHDSHFPVVPGVAMTRPEPSLPSVPDFGTLSKPLPVRSSRDQGSAIVSQSPSQQKNGGSQRRRSGSFLLQQKDLLDNECAKALARATQTHGGEKSSARLSEEFEVLNRLNVRLTVDWNKNSHKSRLNDLRGFIGRLFWAFTEDKEDALETVSESIEEQKDTSRWVSFKIELRHFAARIVKHDMFSSFFMLLTAYALFGPDIIGQYGHVAAYNESLAIWNTVVLFLFIIEATLSSLGINGYFCSGRFWVDAVATVSIIGDTWLATELVESDAAMAGRGTRLSRLVRMGRSSRLVRLARVARVAQVLRLVPRLQRMMERSTQDLALLLVYKRIWHVFLFLDENGTGRLSDLDLEFFDTAMLLEFGAHRDVDSEAVPFYKIWLGDARDYLKKQLSAGLKKARNSMAFSAIVEEDQGTFKYLARSFLKRPEGKRAWQRCINDINSMKESCEAMEKMISGLTLKVCLSILLLLVLMPLLEGSTVDTSLEQGLAYLHALATDESGMVSVATGLHRDHADSEIFCRSVNHFVAKASPRILLMLALNGTLFWNDPVNPCRELSLGASSVPLQTSEDPIIGAMEKSLATGLEQHETRLLCYPDDIACPSLALFDIHEVMRTESSNSLTYTLVVVFLMLSFVILFAVDMKKLTNEHVLHPLFDLIDDMCAMKSMEVVSEDPSILLPPMREVFGSQSSVGRCMRKVIEPIPVAGELVQLRKSFFTLKGAMRSWAKYVPAILFRQLFEAGVEATIGVVRVDVTILFCDMENFKELCQDKKPQEVLVLLEQVLHKIAEALKDYGGTLLEFIGDEVLAVFNAPAAVLNHTQCAVAAAVDIQERTAELTDYEPVMQLGVHRATVLAGNIGSPTRMKYGVLGDGVNLTARLKSLNSRYRTSLLVSGTALEFEDAHKMFVTRPIGDLILKGRNTPTRVVEVLGRRGSTASGVEEGAAAHTHGFEMFKSRRFHEAKASFRKARADLSGADSSTWDGPSEHLAKLCDELIEFPPVPGWDGSELLKKKAW